MAENRHISKKRKEDIIKKQRSYCAGKNCAKLHRGTKKMKVDMYSNFDHIRPLAMGGKNIKSNIQALCPGCHNEKNRADYERIKKWKEKQKGKYQPPKAPIIKPPKIPKIKF